MCPPETEQSLALCKTQRPSTSKKKRASLSIQHTHRSNTTTNRVRQPSDYNQTKTTISPLSFLLNLKALQRSFSFSALTSLPTSPSSSNSR